MLKAAIIVGHAPLSKGATSLHVPQEWDYNYRVASHLKDIADVYTYDTYSKGYTSMVKRLAEVVNQKPYDIIIELHYNSYNDPKANGTEVLYWATSVKGKKYAADIAKRISKKFGTTLRQGGTGLLSSANTNRGLEPLKLYKAPTLLLEPFFGSNIEAKKFKDEREYAKVIREFLMEN